jgi:amino acid adenylation domain-containing protein
VIKSIPAVGPFVEFKKQEIEQSVATRFERQVAIHPDRLAVQSKNVSFSYEALNKAANRVAGAIRRRSEDAQPIALLLEHDISSVVAILAALKAGRPFVPLDPALPLSRVHYILQDSHSSLILTNDRSRATACEWFSDTVSVMNIDDLDQDLPTGNLGTIVAPSAASWILYTSGSTGKPKGVLQTHRNELHNIMNHTNSLKISAEDRLTLLGSYSTGQGMQDIYTALLNGASLHPKSIKTDGLADLPKWLLEERITVFHSAATVFRHFLYNLTGKENFADLRIIRLGSEKVLWKDVELYKRYFSDACVLVNALSCSEVRTFRQFFIDKETSVTGLIPVGDPVKDLDVLLLDENGRQVKNCEIGEIAIESCYLSPGYWERPELTHHVFSFDPKGSDKRIYRTGDLGRLLPDGCLEHLGRKDSQVKVHGFRVEVHEIELALLEIPAVRQVVVVPKPDPHGDQRLVAYLTISRQPPLTVSRLRGFLKQKLPEYMIPFAFVFLDYLPVTPTGKLDTSSLPEPGTARPELDVPFVLPRTPMEEKLTNIWGQVLGLDQIGIHDNFFDLGGNSLLAAMLFGRLDDSFHIRMSLENLLKNPTIAALAQRMTQWLETGEERESPPLVRMSCDNNLPLSFAQERLWFLEQWEPGGAVYNICRGNRLKGELNVGALERAVNELVSRHEILRTKFPVLDVLPVQSITPSVVVILPVVDLQELPEAERERKARNLGSQEARRAFDLAHGLMLRATLVRLQRQEHILLLTTHQIVSDGWSMQILFRELWAFYEAFCAGESLLLPHLPVRYVDYSIWQREWLKGRELESQLVYWRRQLRGPVPLLELPTDHPRPAVQTFQGARLSVVISEALTTALRELSRQEGVTLFMTLVAAFKTLLGRYAGQEDVVLGFPITNRNRPDIESVVGFFVNTLVLRTDLAGNPSFRDLLGRVRKVCLEAFAHQDLPFEKLVEELRPERDMTRNPLFQVMFVFQIPESSEVSLQGLRSQPMQVDVGTSKFDLTLSLAEREKKLTGFIEYSTDLFDRSTIERMMGHFQMLLEGIVANPDQPMSTFPFLTETERHQLLVEWNDTATEYPKDSCIHELFEAQAGRTPEAIAVEFDGKQLTYQELNQQANRLARYLKILGVGPKTLVGICVARSLEMVVGVLGILKAGGAFVPLDPAFPRERLAFMLEDAQVSVLLTQAKLAEDRGWSSENGDPSSSILDPRLQVVFVDRDWRLIAQKRDNNPKSGIESHNLAYVIYTSGSTGKPKGVQVSHRSVLNCLHSVRQHVELTENDVFLAVTTISFDIAALELFLPLITGAKLVLADRDEVQDGRLLLVKLAECAATAMQATPSGWKLLLDAGWRSRRNFKILCGGETLSRNLADQLLEGGASLWNLYGPTETTIWSTIVKIERDGRPVLIGRPIANTQIYILDSCLQPVPVGVHGELYIGGDGLARGYLNRPELTAETFVANPFSSQLGARLYRTGDRARYRADGNIEFLGRVDEQVKIRGHRIELGEIETVLNQHPAVHDSVVVARARDSSGEKELVGYIVPKQDSVASASDLRSLLRQKLPDYMIPSAFVFLNALPLTPNGKVDGSKLPAPDDSRPSLEQVFVAPRSEIEELVAQVWREVLKAEKVGMYDNFFDLGGHSLLATRAVARLRSNFNIDLALRKLFELPTVAGLAEHIEFLRRKEGGVSVPPIVRGPRDRAIPLSFSQRRLWFLQKLDPNLTAYNIPATFRIEGDLSVSALEKALNEIIDRHEVLRTRVVEFDSQPHQQIISPVAVALPVTDLGHLPEDRAAAEIQRLSAEDTRQPYNLGNPPLMRAKLLRLNNREHVLILNFHHIVSDGSSLIVFYQELATLYEAFLAGRAHRLPSLPVQYADYAVWQHEWLQAKVFQSQLDYWRRQLGNGLMSLNLPTDYERPAVQSFRGARLTQLLSQEVTQSLKGLSRKEGVTLFMTLLAGLNILLSRHTGQSDIIVGSAVAGRNRPETDGLIGFFINALALRTDLSGNPTFVDLLKRVREVCLDAYTHQDLPFERVVEEINPQRDLSRNPLFQVMFNMADVSERSFALQGCKVTKLSSVDPSAKFDIVLHAPEVDGRIELAVVYNADLFSEGRITNLLDQFAYLLSQVADDPQREIDGFSLVTPSAVSVIPDPTESLNDTWEGSIHQLFAKQAERAADLAAVIDSDNRWSYGELDRRGNRLANYLIAQGIKPKDVVAIYAQRSAALVVALLGILKAGAAFVILDPAYPASRLISYLRIARPRAWLHIEGSGEMAEQLKEFLTSLDLCCQLTLRSRKLSSDNNPLNSSSELDPNLAIQAYDPAYIAFTSGSTGEPKGVLSRHGPITHFLPWQRETFDLRETDRFSLLSGLAYNHLHRDVFTALALGATLYVPASEILKSPDLLTQWLEQNEITVLHLTPALGRLLRASGDKTLRCVRRIFFGGDVLTRENVTLTRKLAPNAKIVSFYGATETQRAVGYYELPEETCDDATTRPVPLGRGVKDVQLLLLNKNGQLAGVGELGELYVRSHHLATGYVGDDELTQQKFVVNPFTKKSGDRLFRTGELGRYLPDGNVEWAGRNDRRVNIRGFRVELAEVESVLSQHPAVKDTAVVSKEFLLEGSSPISTHDLRLVAYVVPELDQPLSIDGLRFFLSARLPDYMVPSHFLILGRLPLTPNGKVDYEALPAVGQSLMGQTDSFIAPRNDLEAKLCEIFLQVLGVEQVGVNDNFFRLGGHSLLAAQAAARIKEAFGLELELRTFLESPTVAALAKHIASRIKPAYPTPAIDDTDREEIEL